MEKTVDTALEELCEALSCILLRPGLVATFEHSVIVAQCATIERAELAGIAHRTLSVWRHTLWDAIIGLPETFLTDLHRDNPSGPFCFGSLLFAALMNITYAISQWHVDNNTEATTIRAQDIPYCVENMITPSADAGAIFMYSMNEVYIIVDQLRNLFMTCKFHDGLLGICELVELSISRLMNMNGTAALFDMPSMVMNDGAEESGLFCAAPVFCDIMWPGIWGTQGRIRRSTRLLDKRISWDVTDQEVAADVNARHKRIAMTYMCHDAENFRREMLAICGSVKVSDVSPTLNRCLLASHLRPGERALAGLAEPSKKKSDTALVADSLGAAYVSGIRRDTEMLTPISGIEAYYRGDPGQRLRIADEPASFGYCFFDLMDMLTRDVPGAGWAQHYSMCEMDVMRNPANFQALSQVHPIVFQCFNAWHFAYQRRIYWLNSKTLALIAWLRVLDLNIKQQHSPSVDYAAATKCQVYLRLIKAIRPHGQVTIRMVDHRNPDDIQKFVTMGKWARKN